MTVDVRANLAIREAGLRHIAAVDMLEAGRAAAEQEATGTSGRVWHPLPSLELHSLADLLRNPALLEPPPAMIKGLLYRGRATLMAGREKEAGKTTFASAAMAALSCGSLFLGQATEQARVLWLTEEHLGEPTRRFHAMGADAAFIDVATLPHSGSPVERVDQIARAVAGRRYGAVVVDTLSVLMRGMKSHNDSAEVGNLMGPLVQIAHDEDVGLLLSHHANKGSDGEYRGSTEIGGRVDVIVEITPGTLAHQRKLSVKGRFGVNTITVSFDGTSYDLADRAELSPDLRIVDYVTQNPGCSRNAVEREVGGNAGQVRAAISRLELAGKIVNRGDQRGARYYVPSFIAVPLPAPGEQQRELLRCTQMAGPSAAMEGAE